MGLGSADDLPLESLEHVPVVRNTAPFYQEKCMVCFDCQGHRSGVILSVAFNERSAAFRVLWSGEVTDQIKRSHADLPEAAQFAACAITFLLVPKLIGMTTIRQATKGTTVDYYLASRDGDDLLIFNDAARLEISGILCENESNSVEGRVKSKLRRLKRDSTGDIPTLISVVEFSEPRSKVVQA